MKAIPGKNYDCGFDSLVPSSQPHPPTPLPAAAKKKKGKKEGGEEKNAFFIKGAGRKKSFKYFPQGVLIQSIPLLCYFNRASKKKKALIL